MHVTVVGGVLVLAATWGTCTYEPNLSATEDQEDVEEVAPSEDASTETTEDTTETDVKETTATVDEETTVGDNGTTSTSTTDESSK